jgi:5-methylcytosine-specific restriction endonuclease McrA
LTIRIAQKYINNPEGESFLIYGELVDKFQQEMIRFTDSKCQHTDTELRTKALNDGRPMAKLQCLNCGAPVGNAKKKTPNLPCWNVELSECYQEARRFEREKIERKFIALEKRQSENLAAKSIDWQAEYKAYRRTPEWQQKRSLVIRRANGVCEGCLSATATVVHHTSYANMGDELLYQLKALCESCHNKAHPEHHESAFYDNGRVTV